MRGLGALINEMSFEPGEKIDVYLFTRKSPCCKSIYENLPGLPGYYLKCSDKGCSKQITDFKHRFENVINNFYVSWGRAYVSGNSKDRKQYSVDYYRDFFLSIRQLLTNGITILPLHKKYDWFQEHVLTCFDKQPLGRVSKAGDGKKSLKKNEMVPIHVKIINGIIANCVMTAGSDKKHTGNSYRNRDCWENNLVIKNFKTLFPGYELIINHYIETVKDRENRYREDISGCLQEISLYELGPPLNPNFQKDTQAKGSRWKFVSQDVNDLKVIYGTAKPKKNKRKPKGK